MAQARRSEFDVFSEPLLARPRMGRMAVATGAEAPVASPALELQRTLDEMIAPTPVRRLDCRRGILLTAASMATLAACGAFWWEALRWAAALIA